MKPYMIQPIRSEADAEAFTRLLHADGKLYHFDDNPYDVYECRTEVRTFTDEEADLVSQRVTEMFALPDYDPFELAVLL